MPKFRLDYVDPETQESKSVQCEFSDSDNPPISSREWAEGYGYALADKEFYRVTELPGCKERIEGQEKLPRFRVQSRLKN